MDEMGFHIPPKKKKRMLSEPKEITKMSQKFCNILLHTSTLVSIVYIT